MESPTLTARVPMAERDAAVARNESFTSGVAWGAILGGAFVAAAMALILLSLGTGLGFASASPWQDAGASGKAIGIGALVWLIVVQIISASMGGYVAGRLRTKWATIHTDEVAFRDTAHGLMVWAVGVVITAIMLSMTATSVIGTGANVAGNAVSGIASGATGVVGQAASSSDGDAAAYFTDMLLRSNKPADASDAPTRAELSRVVANAVRSGDLSQGDRAYLGQVVSNRTGMSAPEAEQRVNEVINQAKQTRAKAEEMARQAADTARKALAAFAFASFISMLIGAFCSTYAATIGGRQRDAVND